MTSTRSKASREKPYSCGNYRDHSLFSAREWSRAILEQGFSLDAFERVDVIH